MDFNQCLSKANEQLKLGAIGLAIEQRGSKLILRGTFPPRPNSKATKPHQQRLSLKLAATPYGLRAAVAKAKEISGLLALDKFRWDEHLGLDDKTSITIGDAVKLFEESYFCHREANNKSLATWRGDYREPFQRLPQTVPLSIETLINTILASKPDTRQRKRLALAYAALADKFGLDHDLRKLQGNYSPKAVNPRSLPSDELIGQWCGGGLIDNPQWLWVVRVMACYGLRNHEVFFLDFSEYPICFVLRGKTNQRYTYPLYPEWAEKWQLNQGRPPECTGKTNGDYGSRVTHAFYRYNIPFKPYDLRHSWARRAFEFGFEPSLSAHLMGHSLKVHLTTYRRWIDERYYKNAYEKMIQRTDRPKVPIFN